MKTMTAGLVLWGSRSMERCPAFLFIVVFVVFTLPSTGKAQEPGVGALGSLDVADSLYISAEASLSNGNFDRAGEELERAVAIYRDAGRLEGRKGALVLNRLARTHYEAGRIDDMIETFDILLEILEITEGPTHPSVLGTLNGLAQILESVERWEEMEEVLLQLEDRTAAVHGPGSLSVGEVLLSLARAQKARFRYADAVTTLGRLARLQEDADSPWNLRVGDTYGRLGLVLFEASRHEEAIAALKHALLITERNVPPGDFRIGVVLADIGGVFLATGKYAEAWAHIRRAVEIYEDALSPGDPRLATALDNLGQIHFAWGERERAEELFQRALAIREEVLGPAAAPTLITVGNLANVQERADETASLYRRVLSAENIDTHTRLSTAANLALSAQGDETLAEAEAVLEKALRESEADHHRAPEATALAWTSLGVIRLRQGHPEAAEKLFRRSLEWAQSQPMRPEATIAASYGLSRTLHAQDRLHEAVQVLTGAISDVESHRTGFGGDEGLQADFFARHSDVYSLMISIQLEIGDIERAVEYVERGRAQVLVSQMTAGQVDLLEGLPPEVGEELRTRRAAAQAGLANYRRRIDVIRERADLLDEERFARIATLRDSLGAADEEFRAIYREIKNRSPVWQETLTQGGEAAQLRDVQREVVRGDELLLLYEFGSDWSGLFVVPTEGEDVDVVELELDSATAERLGSDPGVLTPELMRTLLTRGADEVPSARSSVQQDSNATNGGQPNPEILERLSALRHILVPDRVWERVQAAREVVIIPDAPLYQLPFETLVTSTEGDELRYWIDDGPLIRYGPSMTVLANLEGKDSGTTGRTGVLSVSDPIYDPREVDRLSETDDGSSDFTAIRSAFTRFGGSLDPLPGTAVETDSILAVFGSDPTLGGVTVLSGDEATEILVRDTIEGFRYVHLATHGLVSQGRASLLASLALTPPSSEEEAATNDGFLHLHEIYGLRIPEVELAVLSACDSNVGDVVDGEGVFALSRGFLVAGASRVVASQWAVNDESTAILIAAFFREVAESERRAESVDYARALRTAQLAIKNHPDHPEWADPYYWAPFVLTGKR